MKAKTKIAKQRAAARAAGGDGSARALRAARPAVGPETAESLAKRQREISVSEFFSKNRHLLGFDNPRKALLTAIKECVDNSADACEEAQILPEIWVEIHPIAEDRFRIAVEDNGPGIVKAQVPNIFGKLLYGSKFHTLKQARGQQGIGVSAACLYGQLTTGKPAIITSRTGKGKPAHRYFQFIDTKHNRPEVLKEETVEFRQEHGTRVEIELEGRYQKGQRSVDDYLKQVAIANPHIAIHYRSPEGEIVEFARGSETLPPQTMPIRPHPRGVELGFLIELLKSTKSHWLSGFLQSEFSRVSPRVAEEICAKAGLDPRARPKRLGREEVDRLFRAMNDEAIKILAPSASCIAPIGEELILAGLRKEVSASFYTATTRAPSVYRGNPFLVEVGLAYGMPEKGGSAPDDEDGGEVEPPAGGRRRKGKAGAADGGPEPAAPLIAKGNGDCLAEAPALPESVPEPDSHLLGREDEPVRLIRFANRVPLQYQQSACAITKSVIRVNWKAYGLAQPRGSLPLGPMVLLVHVASVWVPFTSESKEAIASYPEIEREIRLSLCECGRRLNLFLRRRERAAREAKRRSIFENYIGELVQSVGRIVRIDRERFRRDLARIAKKKTWRAGDGDEDGAGEGGDR